MAQYLGNMAATSNPIAEELNQFAQQIQQRRLLQQKAQQDAINSGNYAPSGPAQTQGFLGNLKQAFLGPQVGGSNMNYGGQNFQFQTPTMQARAQANKIKMTIDALRGVSSPSPSNGLGNISGYQQPSVHVDSSGNVSYDIKPQTQNKYAIPVDSLKGQVNSILSGKKAPILLSKYGGSNSQYSQVMNEVYKQNPNYDENQANIDYASEKGNVTSLERNYSATRAFEQTARSNLAIALNLSNKVTRSGSPLLNKAYMAWKNNVQGDADTAAFIAAVQKFSNEWAKVTTNNGAAGSLTDSARQENESLLDATKNPEQFKRVSMVAVKEMQNRNNGYRKAILEARNLNKQLFDTTSKDIDTQDANQGFDETGENTYNSESDVQSALHAGTIQYGDTITMNGKQFKVSQ